jgi:tRNA(adenine34) deaminase
MVSDTQWMRYALTLARQAAMEGEVPVGAVLTLDEKVIGEGWNHPISTQDPTAHAEIIALRNAARRLANYRLPGTTLYVTLEPCAMCAAAMMHARIDRLVYGAYDPKGGAAGSAFNLVNCAQFNHRIRCDGGVLSTECGKLLRDFFHARRKSAVQ